MTSRRRGCQLKVNLLLTRLPRLKDRTVDPRVAFAGTLTSTRDGPPPGRPRRRQQRPDPALAAVRGLLPHADDRSILGPDLAASDAQTLTLFGLHFPARLFRGRRARARRSAATRRRGRLRALDSVLGRAVADVLARDAHGNPCIEVRTPADLERDLGLPGGNIFHRPLQWPWAQRPEEVGTWGVETVHPRVTVCGSRRAPRRRGERHTGPQQRAGGVLR